MGNCSSREVPQAQKSKITSHSDWDSFSFHDDRSRESDMISLDRLFKSEHADDLDDDIGSSIGTTTSVSDGPMVDEAIASTSVDPATSKTNKKVTFIEEKDVLEELYSEETLLKKKRKSFGADFTLFAAMFKDTFRQNHKEV